MSESNEMKMVAKFMVRKIMQDIQRNPDKESFIEFRPPKDIRTPNPLNYPWDKCNSFVKVYWNSNWLFGLRVIFGAFIVRPNPDGNPIYEEISPNAEKIVKDFQTHHDIKKGYPFEKGVLTIPEIQSIFDAIIEKDNLIYVTKTW
jgi:hypothetical protein